MVDPTPIPDDEIWEGHERIVVGPPPGHDLTGDIRSIEALVSRSELGTRFSTRWVVTPEEAERLKNGEPLWVTQWSSRMVPFDVAMMEPE